MSRMIDLDKLMESCKSISSNEDCSTCVEHVSGEKYHECIKRVAESLVEPEIDFDDLYKKYSDVPNKSISPWGFCAFLKSKHLTSPKPKQIPVKKYWTLKKELLDFVETVVPNLTIVTKCETEPKYTQYYDLHEEPDYSQVPVGAAVEVVENGNLDNVYGIVIEVTSTCIVLSFKNQILNSRYTVRYGSIKSLEILKWPENVK